MKRFHGNVSALESPLQQAPEVLAAVGVDLPVHVLLGMVDHTVNETGAQATIGAEVIGVDGRAFGNVVAHLALHDAFSESVAEDFHPYGAVPVFAVPIQQAHDGHFTESAAPLRHAHAT